jgi:two-component system response regulator YesN
MRSTAKNIFNRIALNIDSKVRIGISRVDTNLSATADRYNEAILALGSVGPEGGIAFASDMTVSTDNRKKIELISAKILTRLKAGDSGSVHSLVAACFSELFSFYTIEIDKIKNTIFELLVNARNIVTETDESFQNDAFNSSFSFLAATDDRNRLEQFVQKRLQEYTATVSAARVRRENPVIKKTCSYIDSHLSENITLEGTAGLVKISPYYLSKIFKEEKGENFITYINARRLGKAKELLEDDMLSIKEISALVGYNDQNYFSKLFRNRFGMTPTEYRTSKTT